MYQVSSIVNNNAFSIQSPQYNLTPDFYNSTSAVQYAQAFLDDGTGNFSASGTYSGLIYASTSVISFTVVNTSTFVQSGGGLAFLTPLVSSSSQPLCQSGNFISDGLCIFAVGALTPQQPAVNYLQASVSAFAAAPPFSGVFQILNGVRSSVSSSPSGLDESVVWTFGLNTSGTVPGLTSSTLSSAITPAGKTLIFNIEDLIFDILVLGLIFFVPWNWWHKKHNTPKPA